MTAPTQEAKPKWTNFDDWWNQDGKYFDPDTEDVPWFDKRKDLAEYAFRRGWQGAVDCMDETNLPALLESHAQLLEVLSDTSRCDCYGRYKRYKCQKCTKKAEVLAKAKEIQP